MAKAVIDWTPEKDEKLRQIWPVMKRHEVARELNITESSLYRRAQTLGIEMTRDKASLGGRVDTDHTRDVRATREFEKAYRTAAKRNGWLSVTDYRGYAA